MTNDFSLRGIGGFQFENLIRNRIPFLLLNLGADTAGLFPSYHQSHLDRQTLRGSREEALVKIRESAVPAEHAIVLLSQDGGICEFVAAQLEEAGYTNVYWVRGGMNSLRQEITGGQPS